MKFFRRSSWASKMHVDSPALVGWVKSGRVGVVSGRMIRRCGVDGAKRQSGIICHGTDPSKNWWTQIATRRVLTSAGADWMTPSPMPIRTEWKTMPGMMCGVQGIMIDHPKREGKSGWMDGWMDGWMGRSGRYATHRSP